MLRVLTLMALLSMSAIACDAAEKKDASKVDEIQPIDAEAQFQMPKDPDYKSILPEKVAKMGDKIITREQVIAEIERQSQNPMFAYTVKPKLTTKEAIKEYVIVPMLEKDVIVKLAEEAGFKPSKELATAILDSQIAKLKPEELKQVESQMATQGMTLDKYKEMATADKSFQEQTAVQAWILKEIDPLLPAVNDETLKAAYENTKDDQAQAFHILITPEVEGGDTRSAMEKATPEAKDAAKKKLEGILTEIKAGADFGEMAEKHSACPSGKSAKGGLGMNRKGTMVPEFDKETFALQPGGMSGVFETPFGYHIVRRATLDEMKSALEGSIKGEALEKELKTRVDAGMKRFGAEATL